MNDVLYIAAKAPRTGLVKTRLGHSIGHKSAVALYGAFLRDLAARFAVAPSACAPFECGWYITPPDAWPEMEPFVAPCGKDRVLLQGEGDWTERQRNLFRGATERGEGKVVLIGSDSPQITAEVIRRAFGELDRHDLVFGPTYDGGYYLIGMCGQGPYDVLRDVPMSTDTVLENMIVKAEDLGLSIGWVETTFDVDDVDDLDYLQRLVAARADLRATRIALETLGPHADRRNGVIEKVGSQQIIAGSMIEPITTEDDSK